MEEPIGKLTSLNCINGTVVNVRLNRNQTDDLSNLTGILEEALGTPLSKTLVLRRALARYLKDISRMTKELLQEEIKIIKRSFRK
jgi:hypothetical protein